MEYEVEAESLSAAGGARKSKMYNEYEIAHFRLLSDSNFLPYGKSMLEGARRIWKQLMLMEDAMLIHRIMRAPEKRIFKIDIGNIPPNQVDTFMEKIINKMKKVNVKDQTTGEFNLRDNIESVTEEFFLPVRGSDSGTEIDTLPGLSNDTAIEDIEYIRNKLMAALKIPKAFLGYENEIGSKSTLAQEDVRFARTIERLQKIVVAELEKIAIIHLYVQGFEDAELLDFSLSLTNPSMIHEQEKLELLTQQVDTANNAMENKLFSREWVYDNIFDMNKQDKTKMFDGIIEDQKQNFRMEEIVTQGNDPAKTGEKVDEEHEEEQGEWGGSEKEPKTPDLDYRKNGKDDLDKANAREKNQGKASREFKGGSPLYVDKGSTIVKSEGLLNKLKKVYRKKDDIISLLNEEVLLDDENDK